MRFTSIFAVLAASASFVSAHDGEHEGTTTKTSTTTKTITITQCNPTKTDCPLHHSTTSSSSSSSSLSSSSSYYFPVSNSTSSYGPTATAPVTTLTETLSGPVTRTSTAVVTVSTGAGVTTTRLPAAAGSVFVNGGLLAGALGLGLAALY